MADPKRIEGPTEVGKGEYKPQATMTPEQQAEAAKKHKDAQARARAQASKKYQPPPNVEPERLGGGLTEAEMNVKAPGYFLKGRYMTKPPPKPTVDRQQPRKPGEKPGEGRLQKETPKKYAAPKAQLGRKGPGQMQREAAAKPRVDVKTGKPKPTKTYGERMIGAMERLGTKIAPPGSVTRLRETGARAPRTMSERLGSISRTASRTFPGKATRPGGILDIPELAARGKGPALKAQQGTPEAAKRRERAAMSLAEKKRRGLRVTGADVPGHGKGPVTPTGKGVEVLKGPGELGKKHLGSYKVVGEKPSAPVQVAQRKVTPTKTTKKEAKVPWYMRAAKAFQKAGREMTAEAQRSTAPSGKYGTKEQAQKGAKAVKKAVVPKTFKEKK